MCQTGHYLPLEHIGTNKLKKKKKDMVMEKIFLIILLSCGSGVLYKSINSQSKHSAALYQPAISCSKHSKRP